MVGDSKDGEEERRRRGGLLSLNNSQEVFLELHCFKLQLTDYCHLGNSFVVRVSLTESTLQYPSLPPPHTHTHTH